MKPLLSIIIPAYNRYLDKVLFSTKYKSNLKKEEFEVIVSDDSDDEKCIKSNQELIELYKKEGYNYHYIKNKYNRVGPSANRQNGLDNATGKWVLFLDDDDQIEYGKIDKEIIELLYRDDISYIVTGYTIIKDGIEQTYSNNEDFLKCLTHGKIYNKKFIDDNAIRYDITAPAHEDIYFNYWCYCASICNEAYHIETLLDDKYTYYIFNHHENSLSKQDGFYSRYITLEPKWFLNKFDAPLNYTKICNKSINNKIFEFIKNELCYTVIIYIKMIDWKEDTKENVELFKSYFKKFNDSFCNKIEESVIVEESLRIIQDNGLLNSLNNLYRYLNIINDIFF